MLFFSAPSGMRAIGLRGACPDFLIPNKKIKKNIVQLSSCTYICSQITAQ